MCFEKMEVIPVHVLFEPKILHITVIHRQDDGTEKSVCVQVSENASWEELIRKANLSITDMSRVIVTPPDESDYFVNLLMSLSDYCYDIEGVEFSLLVRPATTEERDLICDWEYAERMFDKAERAKEEADIEYEKAMDRVDTINETLWDIRGKKRAKK